VCSSDVLCFFFQAEDGIRDKLVTGVQTCALPISCSRASPSLTTGSARRGWARRATRKRRTPSSPAATCSPSAAARTRRGPATWRSEERRVGKEGRARGAAERQKEKQDDERRGRGK